MLVGHRNTHWFANLSARRIQSPGATHEHPATGRFSRLREPLRTRNDSLNLVRVFALCTASCD